MLELGHPTQLPSNCTETMPVNQLLDHGHNFVVVIQDGSVRNEWLVQEYLVVGVFKKVHESAKDFRAQEIPFVFGKFGDSDKVVSKVDRLDAVNLE